MPYGPAAHYNPVPDYGFGTYRAYPGTPFSPGLGAPEGWGQTWAGPTPLGAESAFGPEAEPLLMFFEVGAGPTGAAPGGLAGLAGLLPEALAAVRLLPEVAAGQRETVETVRSLLQRVEDLQRQVEALAAAEK